MWSWRILRAAGLWLLLALLPLASEGALVVRMDKARSSGQKSDLKLELENTYSGKIESVRATVFLLDEQGRVVGQMTRWVVGGTRDKAALAAGANRE